MEFRPVPFDSNLDGYRKQAAELLAAWQAGDASAVETVWRRHPRFLDVEVTWLPKRLSEAEVRASPFDLADAQLTVARCYSFQDWARLGEYVAAVAQRRSPVWRFEAAVEAVIDGDVRGLGEALRRHPELVHARSTRVTCHDPPMHGATLLHYIAANGIEVYRERTPPNAVEVATMLLSTGAEADALAGMYGGACATLSMLVSSSHPAKADLQVALVDTLVDFGANVDGAGSGAWVSPLMTALAFGYLDAAEALVRRGARADRLAAAAGLGRINDAARLLPTADPDERHRALALAAQLGHVTVVGLLLDAGEDPDRLNPEGNHSHSTPLHQAALAGHEAVVRLLVERGARLDIRDTIYDGTPLGWAEYGGRTEVAAFLRARPG